MRIEELWGAIERVKRNFSRNSDVMEIVKALQWRLSKEMHTAHRVMEMRQRAKERLYYAADVEGMGRESMGEISQSDSVDGRASEGD